MKYTVRKSRWDTVAKCNFWIYLEPGGDYFYDAPGKHPANWFYDYHYSGAGSVFGRVQQLNKMKVLEFKRNNELSTRSV